MPYVNIRVTPGITDQQSQQLMEEITDSLEKILGELPHETHIVIDEERQERWGFSRQLVSKLRTEHEQ